MSEDHRPSAGARYLLERTARDDTGKTAPYRGVVYTPAGEHAYTLDLGDDGTAALRAEGEPADADLEQGLLNLARSTARAAARRRTEGLKPWPDRVLRWRGPGRG